MKNLKTYLPLMIFNSLVSYFISQAVFTNVQKHSDTYGAGFLVGTVLILFLLALNIALTSIHSELVQKYLR